MFDFVVCRIIPSNRTHSTWNAVLRSSERENEQAVGWRAQVIRDMLRRNPVLQTRSNTCNRSTPQSSYHSIFRIGLRANKPLNLDAATIAL